MTSQVAVAGIAEDTIPAREKSLQSFVDMSSEPLLLGKYFTLRNLIQHRNVLGNANNLLGEVKCPGVVFDFRIVFFK